MREWLPLWPICLGTFLFTIISLAVPVIVPDLDSSFTELRWAVDLYVLVLAALVMAAGATSDRLGRRRVYLAGLAVFALASLACGLAPNNTMHGTADYLIEQNNHRDTDNPDIEAVISECLNLCRRYVRPENLT